MCGDVKLLESIKIICCVCVGQVAPRNLRDTAIVDDPRPRFLGHAVITLEWDPPEEGKSSLAQKTDLYCVFNSDMHFNRTRSTDWL